MPSSLRRAAVATVAATGLVVSGLAAASAQNVIPGDTDPRQTIFTNRDGVTITIDGIDRETGAVSGTFANTFGSNLNCTSPDANPTTVRGGTVSTAEVVERSIDYYSRFQNTQPGQIQAGSSIPFLGQAGVNVPFWPLFQLLPSGSAAGSLSDGVSEAADIANANQDALMSGMVGRIGTFTVNNGATANWSTTLSPPSLGERGADPLGVIFVCRVGASAGPHYAFTAFEDVPPPEPGTGSLAEGSLGSGEGATGSAGSLSSSGPVDNGDGGDNGGGDEG
ncbi:hypothetical protein [Dietzia psychralcaliphila]|uniref:hypothetical protein n=1 Tax=Dietzia psychralcaliphila TaxID=139021 RepID=UPI000D3077E2|nr:hypothetical protein [Dietzia psychralcaliphila]